MRHATALCHTREARFPLGDAIPHQAGGKDGGNGHWHEANADARTAPGDGGRAGEGRIGDF